MERVPGRPIKAGGAGYRIPGGRADTVYAVSNGLIEPPAGLTHVAPVRQRARPGTRASLEECLHLKDRPPLENEIDRPGQLVRQDGQGLALAVTFLELGAIELGGFVLAQEERGGFGKGPLEVGIPDLGTAAAQTFPAGLLGRLDQPAVGREILNRREPIDVMDFRG